MIKSLTQIINFVEYKIESLDFNMKEICNFLYNYNHKLDSEQTQFKGCINPNCLECKDKYNLLQQEQQQKQQLEQQKQQLKHQFLQKLKYNIYDINMICVTDFIIIYQKVKHKITDKISSHDGYRQYIYLERNCDIMFDFKFENLEEGTIITKTYIGTKQFEIAESSYFTKDTFLMIGSVVYNDIYFVIETDNEIKIFNLFITYGIASPDLRKIMYQHPNYFNTIHNVMFDGGMVGKGS